MRELDQEPRSAQRKGNTVLYFKQSDQIEDFLTCIGAPIAAREVMNAKLERDLRGKVNRRVNCDAANLDKAVEAAMSQVESIRRLEKAGTLITLPDKLREAAALRLAHPEDIKLLILLQPVGMGYIQVPQLLPHFRPQHIHIHHHIHQNRSYLQMDFHREIRPLRNLQLF